MNEYDEENIKFSFQNKTLNNKLLKKKLKEEKEKLKELLKEKKHKKKLNETNQSNQSNQVNETFMDFEIIENFNPVENTNIIKHEPEKINELVKIIEPIKINEPEKINELNNIKNNENEKKMKLLKLSMMNDEIAEKNEREKKIKLLKLSMMNEENKKYLLDNSNNKIIIDMKSAHLCIEFFNDVYDIDEIITFINFECDKYNFKILKENNKIKFQSNEPFIIYDCFILSLLNVNKNGDYVFNDIF